MGTVEVKNLTPDHLGYRGMEFAPESVVSMEEGMARAACAAHPEKFAIVVSEPEKTDAQPDQKAESDESEQLSAQIAAQAPESSSEEQSAGRESKRGGSRRS